MEQPRKIWFWKEGSNITNTLYTYEHSILSTEDQTSKILEIIKNLYLEILNIKQDIQIIKNDFNNMIKTS